MTSTADPYAPLRDSGQRYWSRFTPVSSLPARVAIVTSNGRIGEREVQDMSLGGLGLALKWRDHRRIDVGEIVHIELAMVGGVPLHLQARAMHMQRRRDGLFATWSLGLMFETNLAWQHAKPTMARYLLKLAKQDAMAAAAK
jgi:hypothetical protein